MLKKLQHTLKHTLIYSLGNISAKLVGFVLLPLYASRLTIGAYGQLAILEATSQFLIAVFAIKMPLAVMRWLSEVREEKERGKILFTGTVMVFLSAFLMFLLMWLLAEPLAGLLLGGGDFSGYIRVLAAAAFLAILNDMSMMLFREEEKSFLYVAVTVTRLSVIVGVTVPLLTRYEMGILGVLYGQLAGGAVVAFLTLPFLLSRISFSWQKKLAAELIGYGGPLIFSTLSTMLLSLGDRYIIRFYSDFKELGLYSLGYKIASVINVFIIRSFQTGYLPIAYKMCGQDNSRRFFSKILTYFVFILLLFIMGISFFSRDILNLLADNADYRAAYTVIPVIAFMFLTKGVYYVFSIGLHCAKKTGYNLLVVSTGATVNLLLNIIFVPYGGRFAAAVTSIVSGILIAIMYYRYAQKFYPVPYETEKIFKMTAVAVLLFVPAYFGADFPLGWRILFNGALIISFPVILYFIGFYEKIELERMKQIGFGWVKKIRRR